MSLYEKNLRKPHRSRIPLQKQLDETEPGYYAVNRIFFPGKYPSATLCTPFFRFSMSKDDWENLKNEISSDKAVVIYFDGDGVSIIKDEADLFAVRYQGDDYGCHCDYESADYLFLTPQEWNEGLAAMRKANEQSNKAEQRNLPF
jgi:hypothetical protein